MKGIILIVSPIGKIAKASRKGSPIKAHLMLQEFTMIRLPTLNHNDVIVVVPMFLGLIVQNVAGKMEASA